jgi:hypothetical protein
MNREEDLPLQLDCTLRREWALRRIGGPRRVLRQLSGRILRLASEWMALGICGALRRPLWCLGVCSCRELDREVGELQNFDAA